jgi:hypothetical protein
MINQKLSFGEYRTTKVKRSWTEGGSSQGGDTESLWMKYSQSRQTIHFGLTDSSGFASNVFCLAKASNEDWTIGKNPNSIINIMGEILGLDGRSENKYAVDIYLPKEPSAWEMRIDIQESQRKSNEYVGFLAQSKNSFYTIHPISTVLSNGKKSALLMGSIGFEFKNKDGVAVAAVSLLNNGAVYLSSNDPKERFLLANACSALLLHQSISQG